MIPSNVDEIVLEPYNLYYKNGVSMMPCPQCGNDVLVHCYSICPFCKYHYTDYDRDKADFFIENGIQ